MEDLLARTGGLPEISLAAGDVLVREGETDSGLWILVSGTLQVHKAGIAISSIRRPGAAIGEISLLLDAPHSATVVASAPSILRHACDGRSLLNDPAITRLIARGLAERLAFAASYLVDLKHQYGDSPGLAMVSDVLDELSHRQGRTATPGSARAPNPDY